MRMRAEGRVSAALLAVLLATGCGSGSGGGGAAGTGAGSEGGLQSTQSAMTAEAPLGTCTESGTGDTIPCYGMESGTTVMLKVEPPRDSGSTSTVPFSALVADCWKGDSGSTSTVPCTVSVKSK